MVFFIDTPAGEIDVNKFIEIMNLDKDKMISMKKYCINNNIFYYEEFKDKMADFFERCVKQRLIDGTTQYFNKKKNIFLIVIELNIGEGSIGYGYKNLQRQSLISYWRNRYLW